MVNNLEIKFEDKPSILDGLNSAQKQAVSHTNGPLLIIAGAGTGKTTVLTRRIAYLIEQKVAKPSEILALTFTEKAAAEMEQRVDQLVPYGFTDMWISTFHAFGDRLLRDYALNLGLPVNFKILTATEQAIFMRQNIYAFDLNYFRPIANPLSHIQALLSHFSRLKDELIDPEQYISFAKKARSKINDDDNDEILEAEKTLELANAYQRYQDIMIQSGNLDFGDQIFLTYKLLKENKKVLKECQAKYKYIMVDEFQDTNFAQNEIVKLLAGKYQNITVVGDDDQSIYKFRGASISNILDFGKTYENLTQIVLNENYRSTQEILDSSYNLIQNNNPDRLEIQNNINKKLSSPKRGDEPELLYCDTLSCEADTVAKKILDLKESNGYKYNDFAILVRANNHAEPFIQSLNVSGVPHIFSGSSSLFMQPEIKMLIAFLKCLVYTDDNLALYQLATSEIYNVDHNYLSSLYTDAKRGIRDLISVYKQNEAKYENDLFQTLTEDIEAYRKKKNEPIGEILYEFLTEKRYLKTLSSNLSIENEIKIFNTSKFFNRIAEFNHSSDDRGVLKFLENLELILEVGDEVVSSDIDPDIDAVNILTAHASKGLEWPVVFVVNCVSDRFPGRNRKESLPIPTQLIKERLPEGDFHTQEERRLFYVAATRAKEYLFLTSAEDYGGKRQKKISPFVLELLNQPRLERITNKMSAIEKIERFKKLELNIQKIENKFTDDTIRLSRQQIDDYYTCPKKFYYAHIVKIPLLENHYLMFGTAIHAALDRYFRRKINKEDITLPSLISDFEEAFKNVGFISREQEDLRKQSGINTLTKFFDFDQKTGRSPKEVESEFEFCENNIKINGRYDLIYEDQGLPEIYDFKTGDVKEQKEASRRIKESTQMMIYALAWFEKHKTIPKTSLYFIESGLSGEITHTIKTLEATKEMIFAVAKGIKAGDFKSKPDLYTCKNCPYKDICDEAKTK